MMPSPSISGSSLLIIPSASRSESGPSSTGVEPGPEAGDEVGATGALELMGGGVWSGFGVAALTDIAPTKMVINRLKIITIEPIFAILLRFIGLDYPSNLHGEDKHDDSTNAVNPNELRSTNPTCLIFIAFATDESEDAQGKHWNRQQRE